VDFKMPPLSQEERVEISCVLNKHLAEIMRELGEKYHVIVEADFETEHPTVKITVKPY